MQVVSSYIEAVAKNWAHSPYYDDYLIIYNATAIKRTYTDINGIVAGNNYILIVNPVVDSESRIYDAFAMPTSVNQSGYGRVNGWIECTNMDDIITAYLQGRVGDLTLGVNHGGGWAYFGSQFNYGWDMTRPYYASKHFIFQGANVTREYQLNPIGM